LGYSASWAALPLGLLLPLGLASWAASPLGPYIDTSPLRLCLIDIVCFDNAGILICLLGCVTTGHLLICKMIKHVSMLRPGYSVKPDMIRDMMLVSFEIDVSIYY
jgi:hypothetical protein